MLTVRFVYNLRWPLCKSAFLVKRLHVLKQEEASKYTWMGGWRSVFWRLGLCRGFVRNSEGRPCVWAVCQTHLAKRHSAVVSKRGETRTACLLYDFVNFRDDVCHLFSIDCQDKYVAVAVHEGFLRVFYNVEGTLSNLTDPQDAKIKIGNAQSKFVSESLCLFQLFLKKRVLFIWMFFFVCLFSVGCYLSTFEKWNASETWSSEDVHAFQ